MRTLIVTIVAAVCCATATPAVAQEGDRLAPNGPWAIDYDADSCALRRFFGTGDNQAYLEFRRFAPGDGLQTIVASSSMGQRKQSGFSYRFGPDGDWRDVASPLAGTLENGFNAVIFDVSLAERPTPAKLEDIPNHTLKRRSENDRAAELQIAATAEAITLRRAFRRNLTLHHGKLDQPMAALHACVAELMGHWNIDVEAHKTLVRPAWPIDLSDSASMVGYPPKMLRENLPGLVNVRLAIDEVGKITGCRIQMPLSDPEFEASSCADIQHAFEFEPALDKDGKPIASYWVTRVRFMLNGY